MPVINVTAEMQNPWKYSKIDAKIQSPVYTKIHQYFYFSFLRQSSLLWRVYSENVYQIQI